jgi:multiple antibiotic resistance protein
VFTAFVVISVLCSFLLCIRSKNCRSHPAETAHGILRVVAFILLCIGIQIGWNGLSGLLVALIPR